MKGLVPLLKKEIKEQVRTYRLLIVAGIFLFFGITTPLLLKYLPQIIRLAGEQVQVEIPLPTAAQSLAEYSGTLGQVGVLVAVLVAMGSVANELKQGTVVMILSKPITRSAFISAKLIAMGLTFTLSTFAASALCLFYTLWLIGDASVVEFMGLNGLLILFLIFCLAITVLFSSLFNSALAAGGLAIGVLIGQAVLSTLPVIGKYMPGKLLVWGNELLLGGGGNYWWALGISLTCIVICPYLAQRALKSKDL